MYGKDVVLLSPSVLLCMLSFKCCISQLLFQVLAEKYILLTYDTSVIAMNRCDIIMGDETFFPTSQAFAFPENSPYISIFNDVYVY